MALPSTSVRGASVVVVAACLAGCGAGSLRHVRDWKFAGALAYDLEARAPLADDDPATTAPYDGAVEVGLRLRAGGGPGHAGYGVGVDLHAGATLPGGFAWGVGVLPAGVIGPLGDRGVWGVVGGVGLSGITGRLDPALSVPVEAFASLRLASRVGVALWLQPSWVVAGADRYDGATTVDVFDEVRAGLSLRVGRRYHRWGFGSGNGYHVGVTWTEQVDTRFVGLLLGYDLDVTSN
ncbi:MAG: hypothetical protein H6709_24570 [Kofleriaceae bacterium]|nr:hypothetical protein [Myxococcales bacterium]MCB9564902.1 hypothetical protein [Kofleriaceae bacterium]MCB9575264.1 hypothetical protein [Kofleriaceae bacterium]